MAPSSVRIYHQTIGDPVAPHWHEFYELHLIVAGRGMHAINGVARPVARGSLALLTPSDVHALDPQPGAPLELYNVIFTDEMIPADV